MTVRNVFGLVVCIALSVGSVSCAEENRSYPPHLEHDVQYAPPTKEQKLWALATCAVLTESNRMRHDLLGGCERMPKDIKSWKSSLAKWWSVHDRDDLLGALDWIRTGGNRQKFDEVVRDLSTATQEQIADLKNKNPGIRNKIDIVLKYKDKFGSKSIVAWDYSRYVSLCGWGYIAGYLTEREAWDRIMPAARLLQNTFDSWADLGENHVAGREFWSLKQTQKRGDLTRQCYQKLLTDPASPWKKLPWALDLSTKVLEHNRGQNKEKNKALYSTTELDKLRQKADSVLNQPNVYARKDVNVVFDLVDRLFEVNQKEEAQEYIVRGLKLFPWNLKYQMLYAKLLLQEGKRDEAKEKAQLVLQYAESQGMVEWARRLLGKSPFPYFERIRTLSGTDCRVVLVPMQEYDKWLILRMKEELSTILDIPVDIQMAPIARQPHSRDCRSVKLEHIRRMIKEDIEDPEITGALQSLGLTEQDLEEEASLLRMVKHLMRETDPQEVAAFKKDLQESKGKDSQWDADILQFALIFAVGLYHRENVAYLGITSVDIYARDYSFLFGWADRKCGIMSYHRFTADFNNEIPNQERLVKRTLMQCLSSIGHIYGIESCSDPRCARAYPNSLDEHDAKEGSLCAQCKNAFRRIFEQSSAGDSLKVAPEGK